MQEMAVETITSKTAVHAQVINAIKDLDVVKACPKTSLTYSLSPVQIMAFFK